MERLDEQEVNTNVWEAGEFIDTLLSKHFNSSVTSYPNQKHPWCKKSCGQELEKGLDEKEVKSKMGSQGLCSATTDQNKILIITSQAAKHYIIIT